MSQGPSFARFQGTMWLYTLSRVAMFLALWGIVWLLGVKDPILGMLIAAVLSAPLSYVLLARPREAVARGLEQRIEARRERKAELDRELDEPE